MLNKDDKEVVINNNQEELDRFRKQKQEIVLKSNIAVVEKVKNNSKDEGKDEKEAIRISEEQEKGEFINQEMKAISKLRIYRTKKLNW